MSKEIELTKGMVAVVDDSDHEELSKYKWHYLNVGYAARTIYRNGKGKKTTTMHRIIMKAKPGEYIDHINGDKLDNRRENLRVCTNAQNCRNSKGVSHKKYKGAYWSKDKKKWYSKIKVNYKAKHLGYYKTEEEAALAYNEAAKKYFGDYAYLNDVSKTI